MPTTRKTRRTSALALLTATAALLLSSLAIAPAGAQSQPTGWVRGAHLVPGLGTMTLALSPVTSGAVPSLGDAIVLAPTASYGDVAGYQQVPQGRYAVGVWPASSPRDADPVLTGTVDVTAGQAYTVAGLGTKEEPTVTTLTDDLTPPEAGAARVRVLPAAQSAPAVDIQAQGGPAVADGAAFGRATGYSTVPAGSWTLSTSAASGGAATTSQLDLAGGGVYTLLVLDSEAGLVVSPVEDADGSGTVPVGGAATGGGGTAATTAVPRGTVGTLAGALGLLVLTTSVLRRRVAAPVRA
ncbi:hypothetical protein GCM10028777_06740 [Angustibacter speluncae]